MTPEDATLLAYRKLKQTVYYDKSDLFLRRRVADFECADDFQRRLNLVAKVASSEAPNKQPQFRRWLGEIDFRLVPKNLERQGDRVQDGGQFISNVTTRQSYEVARFNYFFDGPIELHLLATLWLMLQGHAVDRQLGKGCFGARLHEKLGSADDHSHQLFLKYHELYSKWRDYGIKKAKQLLTEDRRSLYILGLDVQEYFYRVRINYADLRDSIEQPADSEGLESAFQYPEEVGANLLGCVEAIATAYRLKIAPLLAKTHPDLSDADVGLPIGLLTSPVLANWYLREFDRAVAERVRPAYYGRYVDDILIVVTSDAIPSDDAIGEFIERVLVSTSLLTPLSGNSYEFAQHRGLFLQQKKCILQHFDASHSIAGLEKFKKKLEENASDFMLLPVEETDSSLGEVAYDLLYDGSVNKFRSIKGLAENRFELAKHLARQSMTHLLTDDRPDRKIVEELLQFFKGSNAIKFFDLWERVFALFAVAGAEKEADRFRRLVRAEIKRLRSRLAPPAAKILRACLERHLTLCEEITNAMKDVDVDEIIGEPNVWRRSNLIRHHLVAFPLLNFADYTGSLIVPKIGETIKLDQHKVRFSPRQVHYDECVMLVAEHVLETKQEPHVQGKALFRDFNGYEVDGVEFTSVINQVAS